MEGCDQELRALLVSQGELIGSIAHDLKGLINGIEGGMYFVTSGISKGKQERIGQGQEMIRRNLDRIRRAVAGVLYYVKDREISWSELSLRDVVTSAVSALQERADHLGVKMVIDAGEGAFEGDALAVHAMLVNVVDYALEVCQRSQNETSASVVGTARISERSAAFEIRADGFCTGAETRQAALENHYAPRGADRSHLGLFIANKIVRKHGGEMDISASAEPPSTRFLLRIPLNRAER
jgi:signal transduction histidine kinase